MCVWLSRAPNAQVYKTVQPKLEKSTRMEFKKLDQAVLNIVTVKNMNQEDQIFGGQ